MARHDITRRRALALAMAAAAAPFAVAPVLGQSRTKLRVGKAIAAQMSFAGLEVGQAAEIWKEAGLDIEIVSFTGDARMQQAFAAGSIDIGLGSGPAMGYASKGVPAHAVASLANRPDNFVIAVGEKSGVKTIDEMKGKRIGVTTLGSLTEWLARTTSARRGWGPTGMEIVSMGETRSRLAALEAGELSAIVTSAVQAFQMEADKKGRVLVSFGADVPHFHTNIIFAHDDLIAKRPDDLRRFLSAWFKTAKFMRANKADSVKAIARTMRLPEEAISRSYELELGSMSMDGAFDPEALKVIQSSLKELGITETPPPIEKLYTPGFAPVSSS